MKDFIKERKGGAILSLLFLIPAFLLMVDSVITDDVPKLIFSFLIIAGGALSFVLSATDEEIEMQEAEEDD